MLGKTTDERSADFLVPLIGKGVPQPFPVFLAEPSDLFQDGVEQPVGISGGTPGWLGSRRGCAAHIRSTTALYDAWERLVDQYQVIRLGVFDARIVAAMQIHRLDRILTFSITDFARYGVSVLDPKAVQ